MTISNPTKVLGGTWRSASALTLFITLSAGLASADTIAYISDTTLMNITAWDVTTNTISLVTLAADNQRLDSLFLFGGPPANAIVYDAEPLGSTGSVDLYTCPAGFGPAGTCSNPGTSTNTILSSSALFNRPSDLVEDPSGTTFLVSNSQNNTVDRVTLATGATVLFKDFGERVDGLAYDSTGRLFLVLGQNSVVQVDPVTGAILKTISTPDIADGLTFDPGTGQLYAGADGSASTGPGGFYTIDPDFADGSAAPLTEAVVGGQPAVIDGLAAVGNTLYLIQRNIGGIQYDLTSGTVTEISPGVAGADDIAVTEDITQTVVNATPEPGTSLLIGAGLLVIGAGVRRRGRASAQ